MTGRGLWADHSPHSFALAVSIPRIRSAKFVSRPSTHAAIALAAAGSDFILSATPFLSSPTDRQLKYKAVEVAFDRNSRTRPSGCFLRVSDKTFVSRRYRLRVVTDGSFVRYLDCA